jgi:sugar/nucleoside kinase (ribokinase family)
VRGLDPAEAARLGNIAAGEVIGHIGPRPATALKALAAKAGFAI